MAVITFDESGNASITARSTSYIANGYICQTKRKVSQHINDHRATYNYEGAIAANTSEVVSKH